jgi:hypothetical protein
MTYFRNKKYHQNYSHNTLFPGAVFDTRHNGKCTVLGRSEDKTRRGYYVVEFKDSGIVKEAYGAHIKSGAVSDDAFPSSEEERTTLLMKPRYYNVGYIGNGKHSTIENTRSHQRTRKFILWHNMLARCYMTVKGKQYFKGYKGVEVCERWHNFQNFCNDLLHFMVMPCGKIIPENMNWIRTIPINEFTLPILFHLSAPLIMHMKPD